MTAPDARPKKSKWRIPLVVVAATLLVGGLGSALRGNGETEALPSLTPANTSPSPALPKPSETPSAIESSREVPELDAQHVNQFLLDTYELERWPDACLTHPDLWPCYVSSVEAVGGSTLLVTLQISERDEGIGEIAASEIDNALGADFPEVTDIQINNAAGYVLADIGRK